MTLFRPRSASTSSGSVKATTSTAATSATTSSENAKEASPKKTRLTFSGVAHLFVRLRRFESRASLRSEAKEQEQKGAANDSAAVSSPTTRSPTTPTRSRVRKASASPYSRSDPPSKSKGHLVYSSGEETITQPGIAEGIPEGYEPFSVEYVDHYEAIGGVNTSLLLRATRTALLEKVQANLPANALADEKWECIISGPKHATYKVQIRYSASAVASQKPDPRRPVALDQVKSIPGLMTITKRNDN